MSCTEASKKRAKYCAAGIVLLLALHTPASAANGERIQVTGEFSDTRCYTSQVMGGSDFVLGSAHHVCAVWCASRGIPVGLRTDNDEVCMILKFDGDDTSAANFGVLDMQSKKVTVYGTVHERDGIRYLLTNKVM
jgi:hypothetical protein